RAFNETSYLAYDEYISPTVVFSFPGDLIPQTLRLDKVALDVNTQYCFYAWEENVCALANVPSPPVKSNEVCSIHLKSSFLSGNENQYRLRHEWNASTPNSSKIISTEILNLNGGFGSPVFPSSTTFQESNFPANCTEPSTSQVAQKLFESNSSGETFDVTILSNTVPLENIRIEKPSTPLLVSFAQNGAPEIDITILDIPADNLYEVRYYTDESPTFVSLGESTSISQKHTNLAQPTAQYCYSYTKKVCDQTSPPSDNFCTIKSEVETDGFLMNWTDFEPKPTTSSLFYDIEWIDAEQDTTFSNPIPFGSPTQLLEADLESILQDNPDVNTALVRVFTRQAPGLSGNSGISYSYPITLVRPLALFFPNAFTPNNDGTNDIFKSASRIRQQADLLIFNRAGNLIFKTQDVNLGWDGFNLQGKKVENGMYTYLIRVTNLDGSVQTQQGSFLVLY
ncbi:MAG: gliding motility-associated C-terminal domain-containing protein, partial [Spirosomataceae bacterium]